MQTLEGRIYFLSQKGLVALSDDGVEVVSQAIADELAKVVSYVRSAHSLSPTTWRYPTLLGDHSATDDRNAEYLLALPSQTTCEFGGDVLVYNARTRAFTTFSFERGVAPLGFAPDPTGYGVDDEGLPLVLHPGGVRDGRYLRLSLVGLSLPNVGDGMQTAAGSATAPGGDGSVTYTLNTPTVLTVGDVFASATSAARVTQVISTTQVVLSGNPGTAPTLHKAITCLVEPQGFSSPALTGKLWTHGVWALTRLVGVTSVAARFTSATPNVALSIQTLKEIITVPLTAGMVQHHAGTLLRVNIPQLHKRGWLLRLGLELELAFGDFLLELVSADSREDTAQKSQTHATGAA